MSSMPFSLVEEAMLEQEVENIVIFSLFGEADTPGARYFEEIMQQSWPEPPDVIIDPEEDYALLLYTSGTTGFRRDACSPTET